MASLGFSAIILYLVISITIYLLPFIISAKRKKNDAVIILIFVLFLGWTIIGWIVCLIWALSENTSDVYQKPESLTDKLTELNKLRNNKIITEEEFEKKRKEILKNNLYF